MNADQRPDGTPWRLAAVPSGSGGWHHREDLHADHGGLTVSGFTIRDLDAVHGFVDSQSSSPSFALRVCASLGRGPEQTAGQVGPRDRVAAVPPIVRALRHAIAARLPTSRGTTTGELPTSFRKSPVPVQAQDAQDATGAVARSRSFTSSAHCAPEGRIRLEERSQARQLREPHAIRLPAHQPPRRRHRFRRYRDGVARGSE